MDSSVHRDRRITLLAARQFGHVTRAQLLHIGVTPNQISKWLTKGWLIQVFRGVYAVGHPRPEAVARAAAAVLACGDHAVLSCFSAAALWGMRRGWPQRPEVTVLSRRRPTGIRVHIQPGLESRDIRRHNGIRVTSHARTLLDIAPTLPSAQLARAVNDARLNAGLRVQHLADVVERYPHHPGVIRLRPFIEQSTGVTKSMLEDKFLRLVHDHGLPTPLTNTYVEGHEVDAFFPVERVIVELDGWEFHQDRRSFENDRERDAVALEVDVPTVRITWERMHAAPEREAARLHAILRSRRQSTASRAAPATG